MVVGSFKTHRVIFVLFLSCSYRAKFNVIALTPEASLRAELSQAFSLKVIGVLGSRKQHCNKTNHKKI